MKRVVLALLAVLLAPSLAWGDDSRHYEFRLAANGERRTMPPPAIP